MKSDPAFFEECFGRFDSVNFGEFPSFVFDADEAVVFMIHHDLESLEEIGFCLVSFVVEVVRFGGNAFGIGHEFGKAFVAIVSVEVSEVGESAAVVEVNVFEDLGHPGSVGRKSTMVFHDDVNVVVFGKGSESSKTFHAISGLFVIGFSFAVGIDAD